MRPPQWVTMRTSTAVMALAIAATLSPHDAEGQATRQWITESTVTFGRPGGSEDSFVADALALGDLGMRWSWRTGWSLGASAGGGYDVPNEAWLAGARVRLGREWADSRPSRPASASPIAPA